MHANWQGQKYSDDTKLWEMSIPGTHDTCARTNHTGYADKCQTWSVTEQLNHGIRFLDLRLNYNNERNRDKNGFTGYDIYHGGFQYATFKPSWYGMVDPTRSDTANVYAEMVEWLTQHPSEFVLVLVANTGGTDNDTYTDEFWKIINSTGPGGSTPTPALWYLHDNTDPAAKQRLIYANLRGKFVLVRSDPGWTWRRSGAPQESLGLPCDAYKINGFSTCAPYFRSQNYWEGVDPDTKQAAIQELFGEIVHAPIGEDFTYFNWISLGFGWHLHGPEYFADYLNPKLSEMIDHMAQGAPTSPPQLGVVVMDFPTTALIQKIIDYRR
jgi:hypothetical protein